MIAITFLAAAVPALTQSPLSFADEYVLFDDVRIRVSGSADERFMTTPDGSKVVFLLDPGDTALVDLCVSAADGSTPETVLQRGIQSGSPQFEVLALDPSSTRVAYSGVLGEAGVWIADLDGSSAPIRLSTTFEPVEAFMFSPDGASIVYLDGSNRWLQVPADGSAPARALSDPSLAALRGGAKISPDSKWFVYRQRVSVGGLWHLFASRVDQPSVPLDITAQWNTLGGPTWSVSPDSLRVIGRMRAPGDGPRQLFSIPVDGVGASFALNAPLPSGRSLTDWAMTPDGTHVVYRSDADVEGKFQLSSAPTDGSQVAASLHSELVDGGDVQSFAVTADSQKVVFLADADVDDVDELYATPVDGSGSAIKLNLPQSGTTDVTEFQTSGDSRWAVFTTNPVVSSRLDLHVAPLDGSQAARPLTTPNRPPGDEVLEFWLSDLGTRVVYREDNGGAKLWSARLDQPEVPIRLDRNSDPLGRVEEVDVSRNGARVHYREFLPGEGRIELRTVPTDGSSEPGSPYVALNTELAGRIGGHVVDRRWPNRNLHRRGV